MRPMQRFWPAAVGIMACAGAFGTELGTRRERFTIDGVPRFLLGISYYGALGARRKFIVADLNDMRESGFNWIRVWATWNAFGNDVSAVDEQGQVREPYLDRLKWLVAECDRRGMIVDITFSRGNGINGAPRLPTFEAHLRAVRALTTALEPFRNWYFDLANERNIRDKRFVSIPELGKLRDAVKRLDPRRLVTASHAGDMDRDTLRAYLEEARLDFVAPHRPRNRKSPGQTEPRTRRDLAWCRELHRLVPIHYQEPFRRGFRPRRWEPPADAFLADLRAALAGGAAGWCFHNGDQKDRAESKPRRSFDMRRRRLFDQFDAAERQVVREVGKIVRSVATGGQTGQ
ncbi:MAG: hypothetical protein GXP31_18920 [Kiritimatiellaeota bacterium]|nr:hypothetical protein [Kiritimatiellota bacterium]